MSYAFDDDEIVTWFAEDEAFPQEVIDHFNSGGICYAQNAAFERALFDYVISNDYDFAPPKLTQWRCSAARALAHGLPKSLGDICRALDLPLQKQKEGMRLIRYYSAPGFFTTWQKDDKQLMQDYCEMDVATMRQFCSVLRELSDDEWEQYHINEEINDFGVPLDIPLAEACLGYAGEIKADVDGKVQALTKGVVSSTRARKARDAWLFERLTEDQQELLVVHKNGVKKYSLDKEHQAYLRQAENLHPEAAAFLVLLEEAGGSAVSKFGAMVNLHVEGRVHGSLIWNGAGASGRFSSMGLQLQNFRRDVFKDPEPVIKDIMEDYEVDSPASTLGRLVRSAITHKDGVSVSDYSQIECRVLPWLTGDPRAEKTLDIFRAGRDLYSENGLFMFDELTSVEDITPDQRQGSKTATLACGFGGGANSVKSMGKIYGLIYDHDQADLIKELWRKANPWAQPFWYAIKSAAQQAVKSPGTITKAGRVQFQSDGRDFLWMMLPSGRVLAYLKPRFEEVEYPWGDTGYELTCLWGGSKPKAGEDWPRHTLSHITLSNNATQGTAADIMRETIVRAHKAELPILFTVHDELVIQGDYSEELHKIMETSPSWAEGLPIAADTNAVARRYGK